MNKQDLRIVYLGTPDFAVESLKRLVESGYHVVGVVTMPDKPFGRHQNHLKPSPVKEYALSVGLPVLQPAKLKDEGFLAELRALKADLQVVVAFRMLPEVVWAMPRYGTFNLHAALLPQYRGAAPINWAIINGEIETGIMTFFLTKEIDTGDIIDQVRVPISPSDDFGTVHDRLMHLGGDLVIQTVDKLLDGTLQSRPQSDYITSQPLKPAPKIYRETCRIDWQQPAVNIHNLVRGLSPVPAAWTMMSTDKGDEMVKIYRTSVSADKACGPAGAVLSDGKTMLTVATGDGSLNIEELQVAGKKRMPIADFLRGFKVSDTLQMH